MSANNLTYVPKPDILLVLGMRVADQLRLEHTPEGTAVRVFQSIHDPANIQVDATLLATYRGQGVLTIHLDEGELLLFNTRLRHTPPHKGRRSAELYIY